MRENICNSFHGFGFYRKLLHFFSVNEARNEVLQIITLMDKEKIHSIQVGVENEAEKKFLNFK